MMSLQVIEIQDLPTALMPPPCNSVTSRLINLKFSENATFDIYFYLSQKSHFSKKYSEALI